MIRKSPFKRPSDRIQVVANGQIRAPRVTVLDETGKMLGEMDTRDALIRAYDSDNDLVILNMNQSPPIAKIIQLTKYKYQQQQKLAASRKNARAQEVKEVRFTQFMSDNDFNIRLNKVRSFLAKNHKVRLSLMFGGGRALTKKEFGYGQFEKIFVQLADEATTEIAPKLIGKKLIAQIMPKKKG